MSTQIEAETCRKSSAEPMTYAVPGERARLIQPETAAKPRVIGRPFQKGQSGNVLGRPKGAFSKRTSGVALGGLMARKAKPVLRACINAALAGDVSAMRLLLDRVLPKERLVRLDLPRVRTAQDALTTLSTLIEFTAAGAITSSEAANLSALAKAYVDIDAAARLEERMAAIERRLDDGESGLPQ